jgi:hypothetical protein
MARGAYQDEVAKAMTSFEYEVAPAEMWRELVAMLKEHGFDLKETSPKENATVSTSTVGEDAYDVRLQRVNASRYTVTIHRVQIVASDGGTQRSEVRDFPLEWELVQRVESERAAEIRQTADASGRRSAMIGRGCDRGCSCVLRTCLTVSEHRAAPPPTTSP